VSSTNPDTTSLPTDPARIHSKLRNSWVVAALSTTCTIPIRTPGRIVQGVTLYRAGTVQHIYFGASVGVCYVV
jgi:hypothetical protein